MKRVYSKLVGGTDMNGGGVTCPGAQISAAAVHTPTE